MHIEAKIVDFAEIRRKNQSAIFASECKHSVFNQSTDVTSPIFWRNYRLAFLERLFSVC